MDPPASASASASASVVAAPTDAELQAALLAERQRLAREERRPCAHGCGVQTVPASEQDDHAELCPAAPVSCPLGCGVAALPRERLWAQHLLHDCPRYVVRCSSFRCKASDALPVRLETAGAVMRSAFREQHADEQAPAASSPSSSPPSSGAPSSSVPPPPASRDLEPSDDSSADFNYCVTGCNVLRGGVGSGDDPSRHVHYHADRRAWDAQRYFARPEHTPEDAAANRADADAARAAGLVPPAAYLLSCPCCRERLVVSVSAAPLVREPQAPPLPIPRFSGDVYSQAYWTFRPATAEVKAQRRTYKFQCPTPLLISQQEAREHLEACEARREEKMHRQAAKAAAADGAEKERAGAAVCGSDGGAPAEPVAPVLLNPPSPLPAYSARAADTGVFKFHPRFPNADVVRKNAAAAAAAPVPQSGGGAAATASSASAPPSAASSGEEGGAAPLSLPFHQLLQQVHLLRLSPLLPSSVMRGRTATAAAATASSSSSALGSSAGASASGLDSPQPDSHHAVALLMRQGASVDDLLPMYERGGGEEYRIKQGLAKLWSNQPESINVNDLHDRCAPMLRPLIAPLLDPFLIRDLANVVLGYI